MLDGLKVLFVPSCTERVAATRYRVYKYLPPLAQRGVVCRVLSVNSDFVSKMMLISPTLGFAARTFYYALVITEKLLRFPMIAYLASRHDIVFFQRTTFPFGLERLIPYFNPNVVFDFDDTIFMANPDDRERNWIRRFKNRAKSAEVSGMLKIAAHAVVENQYLKEYASRYCPRVSLMPGPVDIVRNFVRPDRKGGPVTIGWIGSPSTSAYLQQLLPVFRRLAQTHDIRIKLIGKWVDPIDIPGAVMVDWNLETEVKDLQSFDIGIMPMPDNEWTLGKLGVKMLLYMAVGVPPVVSYTDTNTEVIEDGVNGYLVRTEDEWVARLTALIENPDLRERLGLAGRKTVEENFSVDVGLPKLLAIFEEIMRAKAVRDSRPSVLFVPSCTECVATTRYRVYRYLPVLKSQGYRYRVVSIISDAASRRMLISPTMGLLDRLFYYLRIISEKVIRFPFILWLASRYDIVFLQRTTFPFGLERLLALINPRIIFDFDDTIYMADPDDREREWLRRIKDRSKASEVSGMVRLARWTIVENKYLKEYAAKFSPHVALIPGPVDTTRNFVKRKPGGGPVVIGWIGSPSTSAYLKILVPVFQRLARTHRFEVKLIGAGKNQYPIPNAVSIPWNVDTEVSELHSFDIGVMPMPENSWTRGKRGAKMLLYMAVGLPCVVSRTTTTAEVVNDGINGFLVEKEDEWVSRLGALIDDAQLRDRLGRAGRRTVEQRYSVEAGAPKMLAIFVKMAEAMT